MRTVEVTLRQLDKLNSLLDGALKAGLNEIRSVSLGVAQPDAYKDKARKAAIDDAIHQAQALAAGFNSKLGPVYSVRYHVSNYQPSPVVRMMKAQMLRRYLRRKLTSSRPFSSTIRSMWYSSLNLEQGRRRQRPPARSNLTRPGRFQAAFSPGVLVFCSVLRIEMKIC